MAREVGFESLNPDQMANLRNMLQDFTTGQSTSQQVEVPEKDPVCCHSSHFDNDGWF